jgi:3-dehydroquinate dehydratase-2
VAAHHIAVLHGPNLNLLGTREPGVYGTVTLAEIDRRLVERAQRRGATVESFQSNLEGELVDRIQQAATRAHAIVINPAAYTHTSVAIADALRAVGLPAVEVHLSNLHKREPFRRRSLTASACIGTIAGFGARSYYLALDAALDLLDERAATEGPKAQ